MTTKNIYDNFKKSSAYGEQGKGTSFDFITEIKNTYPEAKTIILKSVSISVGAVLNALKLQYKVDEHTLEFCYPPDQKTWQHELIINSQIIEVDFNYGTISSNGNSIGNITFYLDDGKESTYVPASDGNKCSISLGGNPIIGFFGTYDKAPFGNRLCSIGVYFDLTSLERLLKVIPDNAADSSGDTKIKYAKTILDAGYDSAQRISEDSESNFLNKLKDKDILESDLKSIYQNAQNVNHWLENLRASYILPTSDSPSPANTNPNDSSKDAFNEEISYTTLFKDTQFCDCEQCLSNQSPAAFFTSLMEITEKYAKTKTEQKLGLNDRRPDLWTLPLTCDNTIIEQPYLQLVNKTLTGYLSSKSINWQTIASGASRFIPYNQSNAHIRTVFNSIDTSFSQVTEYFTKDRKNSLAWIYETIGITQSDVDVIVSNTTNLNKDIVPKSFREATGMSVNELELLVYQNLSDKEINAGFLTRLFINLKNGNTPLKYYKKTSTEPERFENLSADNLFQIRAFLLLATRLCWTYPELNHVLKALNITDFLPTEGDKPLEKVNAALNNLAQVKFITIALQLTPIQAISLISNMPTTGVIDSKIPQAPFDTVFNPPLLLQQDEAVTTYHPKYAENFLYTSEPILFLINPKGLSSKKVVKETVEEDKQQLQQILSGIPCSTLETMMLTRWLKLPLDADNKLSLTVDNLSVLYAHAKLAKSANLSVVTYIALMGLAEITVDPITKFLSLENIFELLCDKNTLTKGSFSIADYASVLHISKSLRSDNGELKSPTKEITDFVTQLKQKLTQTKSSFEIKDGETELEQLIYKQWVHEISVFLALKENQLISALNGITQKDQTATTNLNKYIFDQSPEEVGKFIENIISHLFFIQKAELEDSEIEFVYSCILKADENYLWPNIASGRLIFDVIALKQLLKPYTQENKTKFLKLLTNTSFFDKIFLATLEEITEWHSTVVEELKKELHGDENITTTVACINLLLQIQNCFEVSGKIRVDPSRLYTLTTLVTDTNWESFAIEAEQIESTTRSKFSAEEWQSIFRKNWGEQLEKDRDILLPIVIDHLKIEFPDMTTPDHVSDYFLQDVSMGGVMNISPVREAMDTVQTYLQRSRTGLEKININEFNKIPQKWWEWIPNYRVWQANQKILQYPENYIQADIRSNESDLFKDFKNSLHQQDLTDVNADVAFKRYLNGWVDIASLRVVDMCQYKVFDKNRSEDGNTLFVFAKDPQNVYTYYYNTEDEYGNWSQWKKIDVKINSDTINSVYIHNRLFVFWMERSTAKGNDPTLQSVQGKYTLHKATIKYIYQDFNGDWSATQTLKELPYYLDMQKDSTLITCETKATQRLENLFLSLSLWGSKISLTPIEYTDKDGIKQVYLQIFWGPTVSYWPDKDWNPKDYQFTAYKNAPAELDGFFTFMNYNLNVMRSTMIVDPKVEVINVVPPIYLNAQLNQVQLFGWGSNIVFKSKQYTDINWGYNGTFGADPYGYNFIYGNYSMRAIPNYANLFAVNPKYFDSPRGNFDAVRNLPLAFWIDLPIGTYLFRNKPDKNFDPVIKINDSSFINGIVYIENTTIPTSPDTLIEFKTTRVRSNSVEKIEKEVFNNGIEGCLSFDVQKAPDLVDMPPLLTPQTTANTFMSNKSIQLPKDAFVMGILNCIYNNTGGEVRIKSEKHGFTAGASAFKREESTLKIATASVPFNKNSVVDLSSSTYASSPKLAFTLSYFNDVFFSEEWQSFKINPEDNEASFKIDSEHFLLVTASPLANQGEDGVAVRGSIFLHPANHPEQVLAGCSIHDSPPIDTSIKKQSFCIPLSKGEYVLAKKDIMQVIGKKVIEFNYYLIPVVGHTFSQRDFITDTNHIYRAEEDGILTVTISSESPGCKIQGGVLIGQTFDEIYDTLAELTTEDYKVDFDRLWEYVTIPGASIYLKGNDLMSRYSTVTVPIPKNSFYKIIMQFDGNSSNVRFNWTGINSQKPSKKTGVYFDDIFYIYPTSESKPPRISPPDILSIDQIDFNGAYGLYAWELFFYGPSLVASTFNKNLMYSEAQKWWQFIFNPIGVSPQEKQKAWQFLPFRDFEGEIDDFWQDIGKLTLLNAEPFNPDFIAQIRHDAYMKWVVMQYLDNLLSWGDMEFGADTWESLSAATLLYFDAEDLLGKKPDKDSCSDSLEKANRTYNDIYKHKSALNNFDIDQENILPNLQNLPCTPIPSILPAKYFGLLPNTQLEAYWLKVKDRLYKLRHGLNLQGVVEMPSLYGQSINPLVLARMEAAGGVNPESASLLQSQIPIYRFKTIINNAINMAEMVSNFGSGLLNALEQNDAQSLQQLQSNQQVVLLNMISQGMQQSIEAAQGELDALQVSLATNKYNQEYYQGLINSGLNAAEIANLTLYGASGLIGGVSSEIKLDSVAAYLIPTIFGFSDGGMQPGSSVQAVAQALDSTSQVLQTEAMLSAAIAEYQRRNEEWNNQLQLATYAIEQINKQIDIANIRISIATADLQQHLLSVQQSTDVQNFLTRKFTNKELYSWLSGQISSLFFDAYQLALSMAHMAQRAYKYELFDDKTNFIPANSWDSIHKGLMAGETLKLALNQMQKSYFQNNTRWLEVEKTIPLKIKNVEKWNEFIEQGILVFDITKSDLEVPVEGSNYYFTKTVSISIPAVIGPYQTFNGILRQTKNQTNDDKASADYGKNNQRIVISKGINDSGMFALNYDDERYLPFEGTGAISSWEFNLTDKDKVFRQQISDVIFNLKYVIK